LILLFQCATSAAAACPFGQWEFNQNCYFFSNSQLNWARAQEFCSTANGFLTSVGNAFENSQLLGQPPS
jgi:hypothetical protein